jgi:hypothetical protein
MDRRWTKESILSEAKQFDSKIEWKRTSPSSYKAARREGLLEEASKHMRVLWSKKWDKDSVLNEALKFKTRSEWFNSSPNSYNAARRLGIMRICTEHMSYVSERGKWTEKSVVAKSKEFVTLTEWARKSSGSYEAAKRLGVKTDFSPLWSRKWSKASLEENAKKYGSITEWMRENPGAYKAAKKLGIVEDVCRHMKALGGRSTMENDLMSYVKSIFPKAQRIGFTNKDMKYVAKRFCLDIYVPELRKGIEFDGDYWHSNEGLKRGRPSWTDEQIENYHALKDSFFQERGIGVLHIQEKDWKTKKDQCIKDILEFLKG